MILTTDDIDDSKITSGICDCLSHTDKEMLSSSIENIIHHFLERIESLTCDVISRDIDIFNAVDNVSRNEIEKYMKKDISLLEKIKIDLRNYEKLSLKVYDTKECEL